MCKCCVQFDMENYRGKIALQTAICTHNSPRWLEWRKDTWQILWLPAWGSPGLQTHWTMTCCGECSVLQRKMSPMAAMTGGFCWRHHFKAVSSLGSVPVPGGCPCYSNRTLAPPWQLNKPLQNNVRKASPHAGHRPEMHLGNMQVNYLQYGYWTANSQTNMPPMTLSKTQQINQ